PQIINELKFVIYEACSASSRKFGILRYKELKSLYLRLFGHLQEVSCYKFVIQRVVYRGLL
ncbi:Hypothetical protein FKW44_020175, partial [Caligus rogercresseyi]